MSVSFINFDVDVNVKPSKGERCLRIYDIPIRQVESANRRVNMLEQPGRSRKPLAALVQQKTMLIVGDTTMAENSIQCIYIYITYL